MKTRSRLRQNPLSAYWHNKIITDANKLVNDTFSQHCIKGFFIYYGLGKTRPVGQFAVTYSGTPRNNIGVPVNFGKRISSEIEAMLAPLDLGEITYTLTEYINE